MIRCNNCRNEIPESSKFCGICGTPVNAPDMGIQKEKECLDGFYRLYKYERLAWKISGIVLLIISCLFGLFALMFLAMSATEGMTAFLGVYYLVFSVILLPVAIVNLKMVGKAEHYMNIVYTDAPAVEERSGNVGMIILSAFFNEIAMIFIIINFVRTKNNKEVLRSAAVRQAQFRNKNGMD